MRTIEDVFAYMVRTQGEPLYARRIDAGEAARYAARVPKALIRFWIEHGRGAYLDGMYWICDPAPFDPLIDLVFRGDPEFAPAEMTAVAYDAFGRLKLWHRRRAGMRVDFLLSQVNTASDAARRDRTTGQPFPDDFLVANHVGIVGAEWEQSSLDILAGAIVRLGALAPGEIYGTLPPLQAGGRFGPQNLRRVRAVDYFAEIAGLAPFKLMQTVPGGHPLEFTSQAVRPIGPPRP